MQQKVVLITGATSGIGYQTAQRLAEQGHLVYGAGRRVEQLTPLESLGVQKIKLDISDEASVQSAVEEIIQEAGLIDVLFNNAGYGSYGAVEDVSIEEAKNSLK